MPRGPSVKRELLTKSREAALNAIQTFNNPLATFKTETFIVLMSIAWTYLLHAYYRENDIEYRYFEQKRTRKYFRRTKSGSYRYWELKKCLDSEDCPLDNPTKQNLLFLIGLRNEIEHHQSAGVDDALTGKYLACCLNYERVLTEIFGKQYSISDRLSYALQLKHLIPSSSTDIGFDRMPENIANYLTNFDEAMDEEDYNHEHYSFRMYFIRKTTNNRRTADQAVELISDPALVDNIQFVIKEAERPKYGAKRVRDILRSEGFPKFNMSHHTQLWKRMDAKNPALGYGVTVEGTWYWYERWIDEVRKHCHENRAKYT